MPSPINNALASLRGKPVLNAQNVNAVTSVGQHSERGVRELQGLETLPVALDDNNVEAFRRHRGESRSQVRNARLIAGMIKEIQKNATETHKLDSEVRREFMKQADSINTQNRLTSEAASDHRLEAAGNQAEAEGYLSSLPGIVNVSFDV